MKNIRLLERMLNGLDNAINEHPIASGFLFLNGIAFGLGLAASFA